MIYYIRDEYGELIGLKDNNRAYFYKKNYQGDIIGIYDSNYNLIVNYIYDSWGNIISITDNNGTIITDANNIGIINPFRYRSYYYDVETKLYYLNSRYYNPLWGRFINADTVLLLTKKLGINIYIYANNNPICFYDNNGNTIFAFVNKVGKKFYETIKKVNNTINIGIAKIFKHTDAVVEVGHGPGVDAKIENVNVGVGGYNDKTITCINGSCKTITQENISSNVGPASFAVSFEHIDHNEVNPAPMTCTYNDNIIMLPKDLKGCDGSSTSVSIGIGPLSYSITPDGEEEIFIGLDLSLHFIYGGHVKLGIKISNN